MSASASERVRTSQANRQLFDIDFFFFLLFYDWIGNGFKDKGKEDRVVEIFNQNITDAAAVVVVVDL